MSNPVEAMTLCHDSRPCFAKKRPFNYISHVDGDIWVCDCLDTTYPDGQCPFCKPVRTITHGVTYPHRDDLGAVYALKAEKIAKRDAGRDKNYIMVQPLENFSGDLTAKAITTLNVNGYHTIGDICRTTEKHLMKIHGFGDRSISNVCKLLSKYGLALKGA